MREYRFRVVCNSLHPVYITVESNSIVAAIQDASYRAGHYCAVHGYTYGYVEVCNG